MLERGLATAVGAAVAVASLVALTMGLIGGHQDSVARTLGMPSLDNTSRLSGDLRTGYSRHQSRLGTLHVIEVSDNGLDGLSVLLPAGEVLAAGRTYATPVAMSSGHPEIQGRIRNSDPLPLPNGLAFGPGHHVIVNVGTQPVHGAADAGSAPVSIRAMTPYSLVMAGLLAALIFLLMMSQRIHSEAVRTLRHVGLGPAESRLAVTGGLASWVMAGGAVAFAVWQAAHGRLGPTFGLLGASGFVEDHAHGGRALAFAAACTSVLIVGAYFIAGRLRETPLARPTAPQRRPRHWAALAAAALVLTVAGINLGRWGEAPDGVLLLAQAGLLLAAAALFSTLLRLAIDNIAARDWRTDTALSLVRRAPRQRALMIVTAVACGLAILVPGWVRPIVEAPPSNASLTIIPVDRDLDAWARSLDEAHDRSEPLLVTPVEVTVAFGQSRGHTAMLGDCREILDALIVAYSGDCRQDARAGVWLAPGTSDPGPLTLMDSGARGTSKPVEGLAAVVVHSSSMSADRLLALHVADAAILAGLRNDPNAFLETEGWVDREELEYSRQSAAPLAIAGASAAVMAAAIIALAGLAGIARGAERRMTLQRLGTTRASVAGIETLVELSRPLSVAAVSVSASALWLALTSDLTDRPVATLSQGRIPLLVAVVTSGVLFVFLAAYRRVEPHSGG